MESRNEAKHAFFFHIKQVYFILLFPRSCSALRKFLSVCRIPTYLKVLIFYSFDFKRELILGFQRAK